MRSLIVAALLFASQAHATGDCISPDESELARLVNEYRTQNGLAALPVSRWLSATGQWHAWDLIANNPVTGACNLHSWSGARPDLWSAVCYTADHAQAAQMWIKPWQISAGRYVGNGFELAAVAFPAQTPISALNWWKGSPAHNDVILQRGAWASINLRGLGTGMLGTVAVLWFGDSLDTDVAMLPCATDDIFTNGFEG